MRTNVLRKIRMIRDLTLRDLYFKINKEIKLTRLSDIQVNRSCITDKEIDILNKYLNLTDNEILELQNMIEDKALEESLKMMKTLMDLVPKDLKAGQSIETKCPNCESNLNIARAEINGHLWIVCEKEGVLLCQ